MTEEKLKENLKRIIFLRSEIISLGYSVLKQFYIEGGDQFQAVSLLKDIFNDYVNDDVQEEILFLIDFAAGYNNFGNELWGTKLLSGHSRLKSLSPSIYKLIIFADYFQFYLEDEKRDSLVQGYSDLWNDQTVREMLAVSPLTVAIRTARNMDVPVTISIHKIRPDIDISPYSRVMECGLTVKSGKVAVFGCTDYEPTSLRIPLKPGFYGLYIKYGDLDKLSEDELDGEDYYDIDIWPEIEELSVRVVKS